jgi:hypothetical protein
MRTLFILKKITEILLIGDGLTVPQIQYQLRKLFGIAVHQKLISTILIRHSEQLDIILKHGQSVVILTPQYRTSIESEKTKNGRTLKLA